ncbi:MAG: hypothetical protein ABEH81_00875 [Halopenitus sp.]
MRTSHRGVLQEVAEEYGLRQTFVKAIASTKDERRKATVLHALAGKMPGKTGRVLCNFCECRMSDPACNIFKKTVKRQVKYVLDDYFELFCPKCKEKMETYKPVEVRVDEPEAKIAMGSDFPPEPIKVETETKTKVEPCGCLLDEPKKISAIDRYELNQDARVGKAVYGYEGQATHGMDPLGELEAYYPECEDDG